MMARLERIAAIRQREPLVREMIWGIHVEGPFINETPGYVGAHPPQAVRPADVENMKRLLEAAGGLTRLVTLAPERDTGLKVVRHLAQQGILVAAGHSNASLDQLQAAIDAGLSLFTHLGNGCPPLLAAARQHHPTGVEPAGPLDALFHRRRRARSAGGAGKLSAAGRRRARGRRYRRDFRRPAKAGALYGGIAKRRYRRGHGCPLARQFAPLRLDGDHAADSCSAA